MKPEQELRFSDTCGARSCQRLAIKGRRRCAYHSEQASAFQREYRDRHRDHTWLGAMCANDGTPRPEWMDDPSLLPKRPPGRAA